MAPADVGLARLCGQTFGFRFCNSTSLQPRLQHLHGLGAILMLAALLLDRYGNAGRDVGDADRQIGLVDVLAAPRPTPVGVDRRSGLSRDLDLDVVVDLRIDPDRGKAGLPPGVASNGEMRARR